MLSRTPKSRKRNSRHGEPNRISLRPSTASIRRNKCLRFWDTFEVCGCWVGAIEGASECVCLIAAEKSQRLSASEWSTRITLWFHLHHSLHLYEIANIEYFAVYDDRGQIFIREDPDIEAQAYFRLFSRSTDRIYQLLQRSVHISGIGGCLSLSLNDMSGFSSFRDPPLNCHTLDTPYDRN